MEKSQGNGEGGFFSPRQERLGSSGRNFNVTNAMSAKTQNNKSDFNMTGGQFNQFIDSVTDNYNAA